MSGNRIQLEFEARQNRLYTQEESAREVAEDIEEAFSPEYTKHDHAMGIFQRELSRDQRFMSIFGQPMSPALVKEVQSILDSQLALPYFYSRFPRLVKAMAIMDESSTTVEIQLKYLDEDNYTDRDVLEYRKENNLPVWSP